MARRGPWRYVVFAISSASSRPDIVSASLRRGSSLEETETPKRRPFPGGSDGIVTTRVKVDAQWHPDGIREHPAPCGSNQPGECTTPSDPWQN